MARADGVAVPFVRVPCWHPPPARSNTYNSHGDVQARTNLCVAPRYIDVATRVLYCSVLSLSWDGVVDMPPEHRSITMRTKPEAVPVGPAPPSPARPLPAPARSQPRRCPSGGLRLGSSIAHRHRLPATAGRATVRRPSGGGGRVHRTRVHSTGVHRTRVHAA